jgi:hypothetical protein
MNEIAFFITPIFIIFSLCCALKVEVEFLPFFQVVFVCSNSSFIPLFLFRERGSLSLSLSLSQTSLLYMPKLKNGEMVMVVKVSMMMRANNNAHLLRRRLRRRREGVLLSADLEEKRPPHVFSLKKGGKKRVPTSKKQTKKKFTSSSRVDDDDDAGFFEGEQQQQQQREQGTALFSSFDDILQEHSGSIEDAFTSETQFQRTNWERVEREDRKLATNLRRSASTFYVVSSVLFVLRNVIVPANANRNEFLIVFDAVYTFICLAFFASNLAEKERIGKNKSSRSALLFGNAAVAAAANFVIAAATMDIEQIDEVLIESAPRSKVILYALPSIALVAFQVGLELFGKDDSAEKKATEEMIVRAEHIQATKGIDKKLLGVKKITVELKNIVPNWITFGKIAKRSVRPLQFAGAILVNIDLLERTMLSISTGKSDAFVLFHGSWTRDLSSFGSYAFVLASVMVFIQTSAEIQIERAKKLYVDEFESIESLEEVNRDP